MDKKKLTDFLLKARTKTYAGEAGKVKPAFKDSYQLEYKDENWSYRDVYNNGNGLFMGFETIYLQDKPVWSMSYYGNFQKMTEEEIDKILRRALIDKWKTARLWNDVKYDIGNYRYTCEGSGNIDELEGTENVFKDGKQVYFFFYAGGFIGK